MPVKDKALLLLHGALLGSLPLFLHSCSISSIGTYCLVCRLELSPFSR